MGGEVEREESGKGGEERREGEVFIVLHTQQQNENEKK